MIDERYSMVSNGIPVALSLSLVRVEGGTQLASVGQ